MLPLLTEGLEVAIGLIPTEVEGLPTGLLVGLEVPVLPTDALEIFEGAVKSIKVGAVALWPSFLGL